MSQRVQRGSCWNGVGAKAYVVCYFTAVVPLVLLLFHWITLLLKQIMLRLLILIICCCDGDQWAGLHHWATRLLAACVQIAS